MAFEIPLKVDFSCRHHDGITNSILTVTGGIEFNSIPEKKYGVTWNGRKITHAVFVRSDVRLHKGRREQNGVAGSISPSKMLYIGIYPNGEKFPFTEPKFCSLMGKNVLFTVSKYCGKTIGSMTNT